MKKSYVLFPVSGAILGLLAWYLTDKVWHDAPYHFDAPSTFLLTFSIVLTVSYWLGSGLRRPIVDVVFLFVTAIVAALQVFALQKLVGLEDVSIIFRVMVFASIVIWVGTAIAAYRVWQPAAEGAKWLAEMVPEIWSIKISLFIGQLASSAIYLVTMGLAFLLELVGIELFRKWLMMDRVELTLIGFSFAVGVLVAQEKRSILRPIRHVVAWFFRILYPLQAVGLTVFLVVAASDGFKTLLDHDFSVWWVVTGSAIGLLYLLFGASQLENSDQKIYGKKADVVFRASLFIPLALSAISVYAIWQPVEMYGLTPSRVYGLWMTLMVFAASLVLVLSILLKKGTGTEAVRETFGRIALCFGVGAFVVHLPLIDPVTMSARSLSERLSAQEELSKSDLQFAARELGFPGDDILVQQGLSEQEIAQLEKARTRLDEERELAERFKTFDGISLYPASYENAAEVRKEILENQEFNSKNCYQERQCAILMTDLNADGVDEAIFFQSASQIALLTFDQAEGKWERVNSSFWRSPAVDYEKLLRDIEAGNYRSEPPVYNDIMIGDQRVPMNPY